MTNFFTNILSKLPLLETFCIKIASSNTRIKLLKLNVVWKTYCKLYVSSQNPMKSNLDITFKFGVAIGNTTTNGNGSKRSETCASLYLPSSVPFPPFTKARTKSNVEAYSSGGTTLKATLRPVKRWLKRLSNPPH